MFAHPEKLEHSVRCRWQRSFSTLLFCANTAKHQARKRGHTWGVIENSFPLNFCHCFRCCLDVARMRFGRGSDAVRMWFVCGSDVGRTCLSTSNFQSEVGEVFGEIGGELPEKFGRRFSSFFYWENRQKHFPPKLHRKFHHQTSLRGSGLWRALHVFGSGPDSLAKGNGKWFPIVEWIVFYVNGVGVTKLGMFLEKKKLLVGYLGKIAGVSRGSPKSLRTRSLSGVAPANQTKERGKTKSS